MKHNCTLRHAPKRLMLAMGLLGLLGGPSGCTLAIIKQLSKPKAAQAPAPASFPEAESMLRHAAFKSKPSGTLLRAFSLQEVWETPPDDSGRYADFALYFHRQGGGAVKGAQGEDGVCFEYPCRMQQARVGGGYEAPIVECNEAMMTKVTCGSVQMLPPGIDLRGG
jgi:hypothetical protein